MAALGFDMAWKRYAKVFVGLVAIFLVIYISFRVGYQVSETANQGCHQKFVWGLNHRVNQALLNSDHEELSKIGNLLGSLSNESYFSCGDSVNMLMR